MYVDIVFPSKNEMEFIHLASILGYDGLCLVYTTKNFSQKKIKELKLKSPIKIYGAINEPKTKKDTDSNLIISESKNEKKNRQILEKEGVDILFNLENQPGNDLIHQRNSGLNQILCKLAHNNNKAIGISFSNLLCKSFNPQLIGRIYQNFSLCKKYNTKTILASFAKDPSELRAPCDLQSFLLSIGIENRTAKESMLNLFLLLNSNKKKISNYVKIE